MEICKWQDGNGVKASKMDNLTAFFTVSVILGGQRAGMHGLVIVLPGG